MVPSSRAVTQRPATASGVGRMNGGKPVTTTARRQTTRKIGQRGHDREPGRALHAASSRCDRISAAVPAATAASSASIVRGLGDSIGDLGHDPTGPRRHHDDAVGDEDRLGDAVGDHHDGRGRALAELEQLEVESFAGQRVERAERLVEEQDLGFEGERAGERHALAHPAGHLPGVGEQRRGVDADELGEVEQARVPSFRATSRRARAGT